MGIVLAIITVSIGSAVGLALISKTDVVFQNMGPSTNPGGNTWFNQTGQNETAAASTGFNSTLGTIYTSWPLVGLIVLALIGGAVIVAIGIIR